MDSVWVVTSLDSQYPTKAFKDSENAYKCAFERQRIFCEKQLNRRRGWLLDNNGETDDVQKTISYLDKMSSKGTDWENKYYKIFNDNFLFRYKAIGLTLERKCDVELITIE